MNASQPRVSLDSGSRSVIEGALDSRCVALTLFYSRQQAVYIRLRQTTSRREADLVWLDALVRLYSRETFDLPWLPGVPLAQLGFVLRLRIIGIDSTKYKRIGHH